ncbi:hypothetical protein GCM10022419_008320 [Nonomuraea rosea]|uniref:DUF3558 domain-containing protein n=1 Tax=Nonomuraea rosea TaxID=638574 RepID=A0ABP6VD82_9ACTN
MRCPGFSPALPALLLLAAACTLEKQNVPAPAPVPRPVADSSPYVCKLVPEQAFRLVSGLSGPLTEKTNGTESNGDCRAPDPAPHPLEVWWAREGPGMPREHMDFLMNEDRRPLYSRYGGVALSPDLGDGMAAHVRSAPFTDQPYRVSATFRCSGRERMIDIYLAQVAKGRDAIKDLIALMRIAQKRYGDLYDCTPGA